METTGLSWASGQGGLEPAVNGCGLPCAPVATAQGSEPSRLPPRGHQLRLRVLRAPPRPAPGNPAEAPGRACCRSGGQSWRRKDPRRWAARHGDAGPRLLAAPGRPGPRTGEGPWSGRARLAGLREQRQEVGAAGRGRAWGGARVGAARRSLWRPELVRRGEPARAGLGWHTRAGTPVGPGLHRGRDSCVAGLRFRLPPGDCASCCSQGASV